MKQFLLIIPGIFLFITGSLAQNDTINPAYFAVKPQYGFILPHSKTIRDLTHTNPYGIEGEYGWYLTQKEDWLRCNCYSRAGVSFLYIDYANPSVLGQSMNLILYAEPLLTYKSSWMASVRMAAGLSYITKVYDEQKNPENFFFSSHLSYLVHLDLNLTKFITDDSFLFLFAKYNHISNGGVKKPNKGMNFPMFGLGMGYNLNSLNFPEKKKIPLEKPVPVVPVGGTFMTGRTIHTKDTDEYKLAVGLFAKGRRKISRLNAVTFGVEGVYDRSLYSLDEARSNLLSNSYYSLLAGHAFVFGKFVFSQEWGLYLYAPFYERHNFFQRYSLTYNIWNHFRAGVTLKAHAEVAENFNVLITYDFK